jgi:hypothetical protein
MSDYWLNAKIHLFFTAKLLGYMEVYIVIRACIMSSSQVSTF